MYLRLEAFSPPAINETVNTVAGGEHASALQAVLHVEPWKINWEIVKLLVANAVSTDLQGEKSFLGFMLACLHYTSH
jgi:hypothetical protein